MRTLAVLFFALLPSVSMATTYYADPAGSGAASCVDAGANVCTLVRAEAVATNGDTVQAACGTYNQGATTFVVNVNITIAPVTPGCAIITGTNATSIVTLTLANAANVLTFGAFDVQNTGGATSSTMLLSNVAYDQELVLSGTRITVGGTNRHIADQYTRGTIKLDGVLLSGTIGAQAGYYSVVNPSSAKKLSILNSGFVLTLSTSGTQVILVERAAGSSTSEWVHVANNTIDLTVPSALGLSAQGMGIYLKRITTGTNLVGSSAPPVIEKNDITITSTTATSGNTQAISVASTDATAVSDNAVIRNNTILCNCADSRGISIGIDSTTAFFAASVQVYENKLTNPFYDGVVTPHGISAGRVVSANVHDNEIRGFAVGIISSMGTTATIDDNVIYGAYYAPLFAKGNTSATFSDNILIMDDAVYGARIGAYGCLSTAVQGATNNAATTFSGNTCMVRSGTAWEYTIVDASQVASFDRNNYYSLVALTTPWNYQGTTYATVELWNAAATVATDTNVAPIVWGSDTAESWYVRQTGACTFNGDGLSYACAASAGAPGAFAGVANINWFSLIGVDDGDTLYVCGAHLVQLTVAASGSRGLPITVRGDCADDHGTINSVPAGGDTTDGIRVQDHEWVTIQDFDGLAGNRFAILFYSTGAAYTGLTVQRNTVNNSLAASATNVCHGIAFSSAPNYAPRFHEVLVTENAVSVVSDSCAGQQNNDGINLTYLGDNVTVSYNTTTGGQEGIDLSGASVNMEVYGNKAMNNRYGGLKIHGGTGCPVGTKVFGNLMANNGGYGLIWQDQLRGIVANNTIIQFHDAAQLPDGLVAPHGAIESELVNVPGTCTHTNNAYLNNIFDANYSVGVATIYDDTRAVFEANNIWMGNALYQSGSETVLIGFWDDTANNVTTSNIATWQASHTGDVTTAPAFQRAASCTGETTTTACATADFRLASGSTLRRTGVSGALCLDLRGRVCPPDSPDIGAYQSTSGDPAATRAVRN